MQAHVNGLLYDQNTVYGVKTEDGRHIEGKTVILTTGTFLEGRIYISSWSKPAGRWGEFPATGISEILKSLVSPWADLNVFLDWLFMLYLAGEFKVLRQQQ